MKKLAFLCGILAMFCQSSFAATPHFSVTPLLAVGTVPEVGSTLALLTIGIAGLAAIARKRK